MPSAWPFRQRRFRIHKSELVWRCFWLALWLAVVLTALLAAGSCTRRGGASGPLVYGLAANAQTSAHLQHVRASVAAAVPHANTTGQAHLQTADRAAGYAQEGTAATEAALVSAIAERDAERAEKARAIEQGAYWQAKYHELHGSIGARAERWVRRLLVVLAILAAVHVFGGIAALFVPGPVGAALAVVSWLANPLAWFQGARDNWWFRRKAAA